MEQALRSISEIMSDIDHKSKGIATVKKVPANRMQYDNLDENGKTVVVDLLLDPNTRALAHELIFSRPSNALTIDSIMKQINAKNK
jgi:hypothetical protein